MLRILKIIGVTLITLSLLLVGLFILLVWFIEPPEFKATHERNTEELKTAYKSVFFDETQVTLPQGASLIDVRYWEPAVLEGEHDYSLMIQLPAGNVERFVTASKPFGMSLTEGGLPNMISSSDWECSDPETPYKWACEENKQKNFFSVSKQVRVDKYKHLIVNPANSQLLFHIYKF